MELARVRVTVQLFAKLWASAAAGAWVYAADAFAHKTVN